MMAHARGVICLLSGIHKIKLVNYPATKIKKSITGNGMASKFQVQSMVRDLLNLDRLCEPPDVADALAVALSHFYIAGKARPG
jgi:crossover junction endodeoxyribonuclease RuvC